MGCISFLACNGLINGQHLLTCRLHFREGEHESVELLEDELSSVKVIFLLNRCNAEGIAVIHSVPHLPQSTDHPFESTISPVSPAVH